MFYDDYCKTDNQKKIFKAIAELSKNGYIALQELDYLNIPSKTSMPRFAWHQP